MSIKKLIIIYSSFVWLDVYLATRAIPQQDKLKKVKRMQQPGALKRGQMKATTTYTPLSPKFERRSNATDSKD